MSNLHELQYLLDNATHHEREALAHATQAVFGPSPDILCGHVKYLRVGPYKQFKFDTHYKQIVTDVADQEAIDWVALTRHKTWDELSTEEIETCLVETLCRRYGLPDLEALKHFYEMNLSSIHQEEADHLENVKKNIPTILWATIRNWHQLALALPAILPIVGRFTEMGPSWQKLKIYVVYVAAIRARIQAERGMAVA